MAGNRLFIWLLGLVCLTLGYLGGQMHPLAYLFLGSLLPLPILLVGVRLGEVAALLLTLAAALLLFSLKPGLEALWEHLTFGQMALIGLLLGGLQNRGRSADRAIVITGMVLLLAILLVFLGQAAFLKMSPLALLAQKGREAMETFQKVFEGAGMGAQNLQLFGLSQTEVQTLLVQMMPTLVAINTIMVIWLNTVVGRKLMSLLGWEASAPPLFHFYNPEWLIFLALGTGFLLLVPLPGLRLISLNLLIFCGFLYFCQGVAVIAALFARFQVPWVLRLIGYPLLFIHPLFVMIMILGLLDLWLDFRRLQQPRDA